VARKLCEAIRALEIPHEASGLGYVTVSIGCACRVPDERITGKDLMQLADEALYAAKRNGRNRFQINSVGGLTAELPAS
jgi:diguanylate cyclase (GGDEF)-like protein